MISPFHKKILTTARGFSLVETLIAALVLAIVAMIAARGIQMLLTNVRQTQVLDKQVEISNNIVASIVANARVFQTDRDPDPNGCQAILGNSSEIPGRDIAEYPFRWDVDGRHGTAHSESCKTCRGQYHYCLSESTTSPNLYILELHLYHPDLPGGKQVTRRLVANR